MSSTRNFDFRVPPVHGQRAGRYYNVSANPIVIGAPVLLSGTTENTLSLEPVALATGSQVAPKPGMGGIAIYEYGPAAFAGNDPYLTTYSDKDTLAAGAALQVVSGSTVKISLRNTVSTVFLGSRTYAGRVMVAGMGATPTVTLGSYLTPGTGDDVNGYWAVTGTAANAWLVVTKVDLARGEVDARLTF